jgi:hypothetical protein
VKEATATRKQTWAEREAELGKAAVDVVAAIAIRDRAERAAAESIASMMMLRVSLTEVGERCGLPLKEVARLKRYYLDSSGSGSPAPSEVEVDRMPHLDAVANGRQRP